MSALLRRCGPGCQWGYVVTLRNLQSEDDEAEDKEEASEDTETAEVAD